MPRQQCLTFALLLKFIALIIAVVQVCKVPYRRIIYEKIVPVSFQDQAIFRFHLRSVLLAGMASWSIHIVSFALLIAPTRGRVRSGSFLIWVKHLTALGALLYPDIDLAFYIWFEKTNRHLVVLAPLIGHDASGNILQGFNKKAFVRLWISSLVLALLSFIVEICVWFGQPEQRSKAQNYVARTGFRFDQFSSRVSPPPAAIQKPIKPASSWGSDDESESGSLQVSSAERKVHERPKGHLPPPPRAASSKLDGESSPAVTEETPAPPYTAKRESEVGSHDGRLRHSTASSRESDDESESGSSEVSSAERRVHKRPNRPLPLPPLTTSNTPDGESSPAVTEETRGPPYTAKRKSERRPRNGRSQRSTASSRESDGKPESASLRVPPRSPPPPPPLTAPRPFPPPPPPPPTKNPASLPPSLQVSTDDDSGLDTFRAWLQDPVTYAEETERIVEQTVLGKEQQEKADERRRAADEQRNENLKRKLESRNQPTANTHSSGSGSSQVSSSRALTDDNSGLENYGLWVQDPGTYAKETEQIAIKKEKEKDQAQEREEKRIAGVRKREKEQIARLKKAAIERLTEARRAARRAQNGEETEQIAIKKEEEKDRVPKPEEKRITEEQRTAERRELQKEEIARLREAAIKRLAAARQAQKGEAP